MSTRYPDCTCWAPEDAEPEDHDTDRQEHSGTEEETTGDA